MQRPLQTETYTQRRVQQDGRCAGRGEVQPGGELTLVSIFVPHVVLGGREADVQSSSSHSSSLQGMHCQTGRPQVIKRQHHKASWLTGCVQRPDFTICLHNAKGKRLHTAEASKEV